MNFQKNSAILFSLIFIRAITYGKRKTFLGQPRGLSTLFFTEMWERFSYYGMRAILVYFMYDAVANGGLGLPKGTAVAIMSIYGSLVYMSSIVGGWISDRLLGSNKSVFMVGS